MLRDLYEVPDANDRGVTGHEPALVTAGKTAGMIHQAMDRLRAIAGQDVTVDAVAFPVDCQTRTECEYSRCGLLEALLLFDQALS